MLYIYYLKKSPERKSVVISQWFNER